MGVQKSKEAKMKAAMAGGKSKKKKWSKGKVKEKLANLVMFDKPTYDKLLKEIPKAKLITQAVVSERLKVNGSVAKVAIRHLEEKGLIVHVGEKSAKQMVYIFYSYIFFCNITYKSSMKQIVTS